MQLSIIEGFYGSVWSLSERCGLFKRLSQLGFTSYCYAPKSDRLLRNDWQKLWNDQQFGQLSLIANQARGQGIGFDIGLSPLGLGDDWTLYSRQQLSAKLEQIKQLKPQRLAVLFDDMRGDSPMLAKSQVEIMQFITDQDVADSYIFCPSYYSFDPILEALFGIMPENYWQDLGRLLDSSVDIFWTGNQVISTGYDEASMAKIGELFQRQPILWDNSLANDGRKTSPYLKFSEMALREHDLPTNIKGVYLNPMNSAAVFDAVLASFFFTNKVSGDDFSKLLKHLPFELQCSLLTHQNVLGNESVDSLSCAQKQQMCETFQAFENPIALAIIKWLDGYYRFDSSCLT